MFRKVLLVNFGILSILSTLVWGFTFTQKANAASASSIAINMIPENPEPYENVNIDLSSYANNLDTVNITWSINSKVALAGIGKKSFSLNAPAADEETTVSVVVTLPDGDVNLRILVKPSKMVLLWEATDSYVPPFYRGKALPSPESSVKVVAIPEIRNGGSFVNPKNMSYSWKKDYNNDQDNSGFGKSSYTYTNDYLDDDSTIGVSAITLDQKYTSSGNITVRSYDPKIIFYTKDTKMGTLWENAVGDDHVIKNDEVLEADPYFLSPQSLNSPILDWSWYINDQPITLTSFIKNIIPLRAGGASGNAKIRVEINNKYKIFQTANKEINVQF